MQNLPTYMTSFSLPLRSRRDSGTRSPKSPHRRLRNVPFQGKNDQLPHHAHRPGVTVADCKAPWRACSYQTSECSYVNQVFFEPTCDTQETNRLPHLVSSNGFTGAGTTSRIAASIPNSSPSASYIRSSVTIGSVSGKSGHTNRRELDSSRDIASNVFG